MPPFFVFFYYGQRFIFVGPNPVIMNVSVFRNIWEPAPLGHREIEQTLGAIADPPPERRDAILEYRESGDEMIKKKQPVITWGGTFSTRNDLRVTGTSNHVYIDVDGSTDKGALARLPFIKAVWASIGGKGLGALVETTPMAPDCYQPTYKMIAAKLARYNVNADFSCSNISRCNFLSYDPGLYYNRDPERVEVARPSVRAVFGAVQGELPFDMAWAVCAGRASWFEAAVGFRKGTRHMFSLKFFASVRAMGVGRKVAWEYWLENYGHLSGDHAHHLGTLKWVYRMEK